MQTMAKKFKINL